METWAGADGSEIDTACVLTTASNQSFNAIHHRLPLVIQPADFSRWLDCKTQEPRHVLDLMDPAPEDYFDPVPISDAVNKTANNDISIQHRVEPDEGVKQVGLAEDAPRDDQLSMF